MATARMEQARDARNFQRATRVSVHWKLHIRIELRSLTAFRSDVRSGNPPRVAWLAQARSKGRQTLQQPGRQRRHTQKTCGVAAKWSSNG